MPNPTLSKKLDNKFTIAKSAKRLFQVIYHEQNKEEKNDEEVPKIKVSELISKMAFYYEKIRNTVDYEEEHLLRKNAIERILRRQIVIEGAIAVKGVNSREIAKELLIELIRAAYLPNNTIPETKIDEISAVIEKYLKLKKYRIEINREYAQPKNALAGWIIALMASDVEERLGRSETDLTVVNYMYEILSENIELPEGSSYARDKDIQIYTGIHRCYLKFDPDMLNFILFKHYCPHWADPTDETIELIAKKIDDLKTKIEAQAEHPLTAQLNRIINKYTVFFRILTDVIEEDPRGVYECFTSDPKAFSRNIKKMCNKRYASARKKLWRAAMRSIIYIFITKSVFAVMLEVPATKWFGEELNTFALIVNICFPALLLFFIVLFTRLPSELNSQRIVEGINEVIFSENGKHDTHKLRPPMKRSGFMNTAFGLIYTITFFVSFGTVIWGLDKISFTWVSITIFLFFLAFVSFFSIRIRKGARELLIVERRENIFNLLADFFYVPIVESGKWLSEKFSRVNVFVFILDFIIEAPFKVFITIAEEWTKYVKERKDEIV